MKEHKRLITNLSDYSISQNIVSAKYIIINKLNTGSNTGIWIMIQSNLSFVLPTMPSAWQAAEGICD
jgi:hypothetical protein